MQGVITVQYYRHWQVIKTSFPLAARPPSRSLCFRVGLFCLYSCVTFTIKLCDTFLERHANRGDIYAASCSWGPFIVTPLALLTSIPVPLGALIVFGLREARCP
ncbi:hypothetical protein J3R82DRAFT_456 [Butyriboletus roseoflavus]|nr:hypothetical protein J3R82DRAFT_456 [Butyriboletus roseoflavus]